MVTRAYDYILTVENSNVFSVGNTVYGVVSTAYGEVVAKEASNLKIRVGNIHKEFSVGESILSNASLLYSVNTFINHTSNLNASANTFILPVNNVPSDMVHVYINSQFVDNYKYTVIGNNVKFSDNTLASFRDSNSISTIDSMYIQVVSGNTAAYRYIASNMYSQITTGTSNVVSIYNCPYTAEKNAIVQTPIVALYSIYYPGEWYPPNANGNPGKTGAGYPWPTNFPLRYAEFIGETFGDFNYGIIHDGISYKTIAMNGDGISTESTGRINESKLELSNFDGVVASLIDNQNLVGYNSSNSTTAIVNGELVTNIDPRTVLGNVFYNSSVATSKGHNTAWDWKGSIANGDTWVSMKEDSRDLLGGVIEIKLTYAKFLDYWPEYSVGMNSTANTISVRSTAPYRIGDIITTPSSSNTAQIIDIIDNTLYLDITSPYATLVNTNSNAVFIVNPDADKDSSITHTFVISRLEELNDFTAKFSLTNYMQYFKMELPKRKFYSTCPWVYKGPECKYPVNGSGPIVGSNPPITSNGFFNYSNETVMNVSEDICSHTHEACALRRNLANFGGFA
jgi:phage-related protein